MKKFVYAPFLLALLTGIVLFPQLVLSTDLDKEFEKPTLKRTASEQELFELQELKAKLLKEQEALLKKERRLEIEKLKGEIEKIKEMNQALQNKVNAVSEEGKDTKEKETGIVSSLPCCPLSSVIEQCPHIIRIADLRRILETPEQSKVHWKDGDWTVVSKGGSLQSTRGLYCEPLAVRLGESTVKQLFKDKADIEILECMYDVYAGVNNNHMGRVVLKIELNNINQ